MAKANCNSEMGLAKSTVGSTLISIILFFKNVILRMLNSLLCSVLYGCFAYSDKLMFVHQPVSCNMQSYLFSIMSALAEFHRPSDMKDGIRAV